MKTIWLVGGGFESVAGVDRARGMGLKVVVSDGRAEAPGMLAADAAYVASTYDAEETIAAMQRHLAAGGRIDGVSSVAADVPLTVALSAAALGLPGIPVEAARRSMDKLAMKDVLTAAGVPVPEYAAAQSVADLENWLACFESAVLKPVDSRGARGVLRLGADSDLAWAFDEALRFSPSGRLIVERFVEGPQVSTEGLLLGGRSFPVALNDRNYDRLRPGDPFMVEDGGSHPSILNAADQSELAECALEAGRALGVSSGVVKGDLVLGPKGPVVIEVALRLSGGFFCTHQIPMATGVDLVGSVFRCALGEAIDERQLVPSAAKGVAIRYLFPKPGRVAAIRGEASARGQAGVEMVHLEAEIGADVGEPQNHTQRCGCVLATGRDVEEAIARAEAGVRAVEIETKPRSAKRSGKPLSVARA